MTHDESSRPDRSATSLADPGLDPPPECLGRLGGDGPGVRSGPSSARPPDVRPPGSDDPAASDGPRGEDRIAVASLLGRIGAVMHAMGRDGRSLQDALSPALVRAVAAEPALLVAMQALDALTQRVEAMASLADRLAAAAAPDWHVDEDPLAAIPLADLRAALDGTSGGALGEAALSSDAGSGAGSGHGPAAPGRSGAGRRSGPEDGWDAAPFDAWPGDGWIEA